MSAKGQKRTLRLLFDNLGDLLEVHWHGQAERFCGLEIDDQLEFRRSLDRQVSWLFAFENPAGVNTGEAICIRLAWPITYQSTDVCKLAHKMNCWNRKTCRQPDELIAPTHEKRISSDDDCVNMLLDGTLEGRVGFAFAAGLQDQELDAQCTRRSLRISNLEFGSEIPGVDEQANNGGARNKFAPILASTVGWWKRGLPSRLSR